MCFSFRFVETNQLYLLKSLLEKPRWPAPERPTVFFLQIHWEVGRVGRIGSNV